MYRTVLALALASSGCGRLGFEDPCSSDAPPLGCGYECSTDGLCPNGLHCGGDDLCTAECTSDSVAIDCGAGYACSVDGRCTTSAPSMPPPSCATADLGGRRVVPKVTLIVDRSGSMNILFPSPDGAEVPRSPNNRWNRVRDALIGPDGLVPEYESIVDFGLALYTAQSSGGYPHLPDPGTECPLLSRVDAARNNLDAIASTYDPAEPVDETPTGDAVRAVLEATLSVPDRTIDPEIFLLATDGMPDRCEQLNTIGGPPGSEAASAAISRRESIEAIEDSYEAGIRTFVLSVGEGSVAVDHLQELANAGIGAPPASASPFWEAGDDAGLRAALTAILGASLSCEIELEGRVDPAQACAGTVTLDGLPIPCGPDGWRAVDPDTIELTGESCERWKSSPASRVQAEFPCEVLLI